jgi:uncharacterized protein (TIGR02145 family)
MHKNIPLRLVSYHFLFQGQGSEVRKFGSPVLRFTTNVLRLISYCFWLLAFSSCNSPETNTVTDIDGNVYHTVTIGPQVWMAENLKVTRYRNGDLIPNIMDTAQWSYLPVGAYCNYNNAPQNSGIYGHLYNWFAVTDSRDIAPKGWHIPTFTEIKALVTYLGGDTIAAGKLKQQGTEYWLSPNTGATNLSGFTALPGGYRFNRGGTFHSMGSNGYWWTTTQSIELYAWSKRIYWYFTHADYNHDLKTLGFSIRCIKDE